MSRGQVIVIYGVDSSGKSTHAVLLGAHLRRNHRVHVTSISIRHLMMFFVYKFFDKWGRKAQLTDHRTLPVLPKDRVRLVVEFACLVLLVLKLRLLKALGYVIIVEKYIPFSIASLSYIYGSSFMNGKTTNILSRFMKDTCQIRLDVDWSVHVSRRGKDSESLEWILWQKKVYERFARAPNCITIDTERAGLKETQSSIRQMADEWLKAKGA